MTVTPPGDTHDVSMQLRLVEAPTRTPTPRATPRRGRATRARRPVRWSTDWHLDATTRRVGRAGVAAARASLGKAAQASLREAS